MEDREKLLQELHNIGQYFQQIMKEVEAEQETYWNSLTKEEQLKCFCAVTRRIYQGEIVDRGTYRWVLYNVFGFGPESYGAAQDAGYLTIHNCIYSSNYEEQLLEVFARFLGHDDPKQAVDKFYENGGHNGN